MPHRILCFVWHYLYKSVLQFSMSFVSYFEL